MDQPNAWLQDALIPPEPDGHFVMIPLTQGKFAIVDEADYDLVMQYAPWFAHREKRNWYAHRMTGSRAHGSTEKRKVLRMHTLLTGFTLTDHANRNGLDNRRINLLESTTADNCRNIRKPVTNTSGFTGVSYDKRTGRWVAQVRFYGPRIWLGRHPTAEAAAQARQDYLRERGEFLRTG